MPAPTFLYRLQFGGALFVDEQWSCTLYLDSLAILPQDASVFTPALKAWISGARQSAAASLDKVSFNQINPATGRFTNPGVTNADFPTGAGRIGTGALSPGQLTIAVSTRTALLRGRAHAGRIYPPVAGGFVPDAQGLMSAAECQIIGESVATLISAVNAVVTPTARVVVFSKVGQLVETVTHTRTGRVMDTQRRRRASLPESYGIDVAVT